MVPVGHISSKQRPKPRPPAKARLSAVTRTAVFLMIGGLLAVPYAAVALWIAQLWQVAAANPLALPSGFLIAAGLLLVPSTLRVMRALERTAANELLGTALEEAEGTTRLADIARGAVWFIAHLLSGALAVAVLVFVLPTLAAIAFAVLDGGGAAGLAPFTSQLLPGVDTGTAAWLLTAAGLGAMALLAAIASQLRVWAVLLLGPSEQGKLAIAERHARELARRNELARELHDSIGHALTVTTLQAAAARSLLASDPEKAAASMAAVEDAGRAALEELDYVLGILRAPAGAAENLAERLRSLVARHGSPGPAELTLAGDTAVVPETVAAEAFRMVQEGLSNAAKHAPGAVCTVEADIRGTAAAGVLSLRLRNGLPTAVRSAAPQAPRAGTGGRGLAGLAERAMLLGGTFSAGESDGAWCLGAELPWGGGE